MRYMPCRPPTLAENEQKAADTKAKPEREGVRLSRVVNVDGKRVRETFVAVPRSEQSRRERRFVDSLAMQNRAERGGVYAEPTSY